MYKKNTFLLFFIVFADMMGFSVIFPLFPDTIRHFIDAGADPIFDLLYSTALSMGGQEHPQFIIVLFGGILGSVYSILQFIFSPIWGKLSDHYGRRKILFFTSLGNLLGYLVWLFSSSFTLFVLSRVITGAMGGNISAASAAMADSTSREDRAKGMGMIGAGIGLGFIFGPLLGGLFSGSEVSQWFPSLGNLGFTVFSTSALISIFVAFLNLVLVYFFLQESLPSLTGRQEEQAAVELSRTQRLHPILELFSPSFRSLLFVSFIYFIFIFSFSGFEFSLNFFLNEEFEFTPRDIGFTFLYIGLIIIFIQGGLIRRISGKVAEVKIALVGTVILGLGYLGLVVWVNSFTGLMVSIGFLSVGSALLHPSLSSMASLGSHADDQGKNLGIFRSFGSLARAASPLSFAMIYFLQGPYMVFGVALGMSVILGVLLWILLRKK
jgi:MFS family permease